MAIPRSAASRPSTGSITSAATATRSRPRRCWSTPMSTDLARGRLGLRGRVARATTPAASPARGRCPRRSRPTWSTPCSPTAPATTSTTPTPSSRRPSAPTPSRLVLYDKAGEEVLRRSMAAVGRLLPAGSVDRRLQEQLRRQGQLLRLPRELPDGPGRPLRPHRPPDHPALRDPPDLHRRRQGGQRDRRGRRGATSSSSSPSGPTSSRRRSASRRRSSGRSSTPATSPTPTPSATGGCT